MSEKCKHIDKCTIISKELCNPERRDCFEPEEKIKIVRDHVEIEIGDRKFNISIDETEDCKEVLVINKIGYENESSQICILTKCSNEIAIM